MVNFLIDWIARIYLFIWHKFLQFPEPFTRVFCRIEQNTPAIFWGLFIYLGYSYWPQFPLNLMTFRDGLIILFLIWFAHHIAEYRCAHPDNIPFSCIRPGILGKLYFWSVTRLNK